jgi:glycerol-3-phosphate dehydrogenase
LDGQRRDHDRHLAQRGVDVAVVGGGITGAGVALDAASRGLSVVLLEGDDLAAGTSRWSSKLVHGGLRYLAKGDVGVAWESARERALVAGRIAPHLIRPLQQVVPTYRGQRRAAVLARWGFRAGDALKAAAGPSNLLPDSRWVDAATALRLVPGLRRDLLMGAAVGWDCQLVDDARLVVAVARTAALYGAGILTRARVTAVDPVVGALLVDDAIHRDSFEVPARWIVNATGVWAGDLDPAVTVRASLGTHVVVPTALLGGGASSLTVPVPGHRGRFVFCLPQEGGISYVGITDNPAAAPVLLAPEPPAADVAWILSVLSGALQRPIGPDEALGAFAGVRPLVDAPGGASADISRRHLLRRSDRMITVTGGKLTTYRRMAADVVDLITDAPCRTQDIGVVGSGPWTDRADVPHRLRRRYGAEAAAVWDLGADRPRLRLPVSPGRAELGVEWLFGARFEGALSADDLLHRRTRHALLPVDPATADLAADIAAGVLTPSRSGSPDRR